MSNDRETPAAFPVHKSRCGRGRPRTPRALAAARCADVPVRIQTWSKAHLAADPHAPRDATSPLTGHASRRGTLWALDWTPWSVQWHGRVSRRRAAAVR